MKTVAELQQERATKVTAQSTIVTEARSAKADLTEEQETRFDALTKEIEDLDKQIARAIKIDESEKRAASLHGNPVDTSVSNKGEDAEERKIKAAASISRAIRMVTKNAELF